MNDPLISALANLPLAAPDASRTERTRARCHARLARARSRRSPGRRSNRRQLWEPLVAGLGLLYVSQSIYLALQVAGVM